MLKKNWQDGVVFDLPDCRGNPTVPISKAERFGVRPGSGYYCIERGHVPARRLHADSPYWIALAAERKANSELGSLTHITLRRSISNNGSAALIAACRGGVRAIHATSAFCNARLCGYAVPLASIRVRHETRARVRP
jgi:hypothetical protein